MRNTLLFLSFLSSGVAQAASGYGYGNGYGYGMTGMGMNTGIMEKSFFERKVEVDAGVGAEMDAIELKFDLASNRQIYLEQQVNPLLAEWAKLQDLAAAGNPTDYTDALARNSAARRKLETEMDTLQTQKTDLATQSLIITKGKNWVAESVDTSAAVNAVVKCAKGETLAKNITIPEAAFWTGMTYGCIAKDGHITKQTLVAANLEKNPVEYKALSAFVPERKNGQVKALKGYVIIDGKEVLQTETKFEAKHVFQKVYGPDQTTPFSECKYSNIMGMEGAGMTNASEKSGKGKATKR